MEKRRRLQKRRGRSVQELLGIWNFTRYGILTGDGELILFEVQPVNLAVLSETSAGIKIRHLQEVLSMHPELEIVCADSYECFDDNKVYLQSRYREERNAGVCRLLEKDKEMLDTMQTETASARQFILVLRCRRKTKEQVFQEMNRVQKTISERGFGVHRMNKAEIKRFLAVYMNACIYGDQMPEVDGAQFLEESNGGESDEA